MAKIKRCSKDLHDYDVDIFGPACPYCGVNTETDASSQTSQEPETIPQNEPSSLPISPPSTGITPPPPAGPQTSNRGSEAGAREEQETIAPPQKKQQKEKSAPFPLGKILLWFFVILLVVGGSYGAYRFWVYRQSHFELPTITVTSEKAFTYTLNVPQGTRMTVASTLPDWLMFDAQSLQIGGTPPASFSGYRELLFDTVNTAGQKGSATVRVYIRAKAALPELHLEYKSTRTGNVTFQNGFASLELEQGDLVEIYVVDQHGNSIVEGVLDISIRQ